MSEDQQPPVQDPQPAPAHPAVPAGSAGPAPHWAGSGQGAHGWAAHPSQAWPHAWSAPVYPGPPVQEPRSSAQAPVVLTLVALGALFAGGVAGFLIAAVAFWTGAGGMGGGMGVGMEDPALGPVEEFPAVAPGDLGQDPVLDEHADACFAGDLQSCDDLFHESAPLSEYEEYAATCGGRVKPYAVFACTELE